jgi:pimeloyl-ACP methyl ester carboxylesterase
LLLAETPRALLEAMTLVPGYGILRMAPRGDGHPVLVLPGFGAGDLSTRILRRYLQQLGYRSHPWKLGRNLGPSHDLRRRLFDRVQELHGRYDRKMSVVGWSLGGIYGREIARVVPALIRQVITLGSPFNGNGRGSNVGWLFERITGRPVRSADPATLARLRQPPPVPCTAIFSKTDGIVAWEDCVEIATARTDNIEIVGSHCGLGMNPIVLYVIADRLAQCEGGWTPFERTGFRRLFYA